MQARTKVRRRVLACARCRKRKLSCDGKVPSCSRCVEAGAVCVGFDSSTQREAPRSIADFLERHIESLQGRPPRSRATWQNTEVPSPAAPTEPTGLPHEKSTFADSLVNHVINDITPSFLGIARSKPILTCVVKGTQLPSRRGPIVATDLDENHPRSILNPQPSPGLLEGFDQQTANGLLHNYLDHVITQYPIYHRHDITTAFNSIYYPASNPGQDTARNRYIISLIMAISLATAARTNQAKANAHAYTLIQNAMQWMPEVATNDIPGLQAMLLLTQYIFLDPSMADVWLLTGLTSQAVIDLGLHQELPIDSRVSAFKRDMRRRLFWVAWEMEVAVCSIFSRPFTLPTRQYHVNFPLELDDTAITEDGIDLSGRVSKFFSRRLWISRQIEAEIVSVIQQNDPWPDRFNSLEDWMQQVVQNVNTWHTEILHAAAGNTDPSLKVQWEEMILYAKVAHPYLILLLHKPSKRIPQPTNESWMVAFANAIEVVHGYLEQSNAAGGNTEYVFQPCYHCFTSSLVFLQALSRCKTEISLKYPWREIETWMGSFSTFFKIIAQRWPAATRCLDEYERQLELVKHGYPDFLATKAAHTLQSPGPRAQVISYYDYPTSTLDLNDTFRCLTSINPALTMEAPDTSPAYMYKTPQDWNSEFNLNLATRTLS